MKKIFAFTAVFLLFGCKSTTTTEIIADEAKETISGVIAGLPKECKTKMTEVALNSAMAQIDSMKEYCISREALLNEKIKQRNLIILVLAGLGLFLIFRKVRRFLSLKG